jgi:hypothetical protein
MILTLAVMGSLTVAIVAAGWLWDRRHPHAVIRAERTH